MNFKRWKLVYIAASVKILDASWNTLDLHKENDLKMDDTEHYTQYNSAVSEYSRSQSYENEIYNNPIVRGSYNAGVPTDNKLEEKIGQEKIEIPTIDQLVTEFKQTEQKLSTGKQPLADNYSRRIEEIIKDQETSGLDTPVELVVTEQNLISVVQCSDVEYIRLIEKLIKEQETAELDTSVNNLKEAPLYEPVEEYGSCNTSLQTHRLATPLSIEEFPCEYSNSTFLDKLLHFPSPFIDADSIRMRFVCQFLSFLSSEQVVRILIVLLENKLELAKKDQKEFIEMIFGHIDYSLELVITKEQVVILVEAMMRSNVPDYFEQIFLTWKMWYSFTVDEQELMLKGVKRECRREILVMLYLFVVNRDENNSHQCEIFKNYIKSQYKEINITKKKWSLKDVVIKKNGWALEVLCTIFNTFDTCLLSFPEILKGLDNHAVISFRNFVRMHFFRQHQSTKPQVQRYKSHVCFVFTKFTQEFDQTNDQERINDAELNSRLYFEPVCVKYEFINWLSMLKKNEIFNDVVFADKLKNEFINAFAMIRQLTQSSEYNLNTFLKVFNKVSFCGTNDRPYLILLFSLTNGNIVRESMKTQEWAECVQKRLKLSHNHHFIKDILANITNSELEPEPDFYIRCCTKDYLITINNALSKLNTKGGITMHREHYFYQRLLFHPCFKAFNGMSMLNYVRCLSKIGLLNNKQLCDQISRDLIFSEYYHEAAMELMNRLENLRDEPELVELVEFQKSMEKEWEIYKNEGGIKGKGKYLEGIFL